jgi:hypothetical protein
VGEEGEDIVPEEVLHHQGRFPLRRGRGEDRVYGMSGHRNLRASVRSLPR